MKPLHGVLAAVFTVLCLEGKPRDCTTKTTSFPLRRQVDPEGIRQSVRGKQYFEKVPTISAYTIDAVVGSQRFNLTLDNNAQSPVLFAKGFAPYEPTFEQLPKGFCLHKDGPRNYFDVNNSTTFSDTGDKYSGWGMNRNPYVLLGDCPVPTINENGSWTESFTGIRAADTFSLLHWSSDENAEIESFTLSKVPFVLASQANFLINYRWPSDGIFPLGLRSGEVLPRILHSVGGKQEVTLWLNDGAENNDTLAPGGQITFGGKDTENCGSKWTRVGSANGENWSVTLNGFYFRLPSGELVYHMGNYERYHVTAEISIATPLLTIPREQFREIMGRLNATYNEDLALYTVPLYDSHKIPSIQINLGDAFDSIYYTVPAEQLYSLYNTNECALMIDCGWNGEWVIGSRFLPKRCVHFDYANNRISFADPLKVE